MAGNEKSGAGLRFRMSEDKLREAIEQFKTERGKGQEGMVTWEMFCGFIGYSIEVVQECYLRGKDGTKNAYNGRAELLESFYTDCMGLMFATCGGKTALAKELSGRDYLHPEKNNDAGANEVRILFGCQGDSRWQEAMK